MERAQPFIRAARLFKLHVRGHHIDDVEAVLDLVDKHSWVITTLPGRPLKGGKKDYTRATRVVSNGFLADLF